MSGFNGTAFKGLTKTDVVNNLTSTATTQPLSAAQGKELNDKINAFNTDTYRGITSLSDFETYRNNKWYGTIGGTTQLNLSFSANICFCTISFSTDYIHVYAIRANGELWNLNKNNGTWDSEWTKMF